MIGFDIRLQQVRMVVIRRHASVDEPVTMCHSFLSCSKFIEWDAVEDSLEIP